jgi:uncharacterized membrane protein YoaK (UPF0700 family)
MRTIGAVAAGLAAWILVATAGNLVLRMSWPAYAVVEKAMLFGGAMLISRLLLGAVSSLVAGFVTASLSRRSTLAAWSLVVLLLAVFVPIHLHFWQRFPVWYHLVFFASLAVFTLFGARRR